MGVMTSDPATTMLLVIDQDGSDVDLICADFEYQEDAREVLKDDPRDPHRLDTDEDSIACEHLPSRS